MNYTKTQKSIIFEIPLSDYFGKRYFRKWDAKKMQAGERQEKWIESAQEYEEKLFENFESFSPYIGDADLADYIEPAKYYLLTLHYTPAEIEQFNGELKQDIRRALSDAKDQSYQDEWLKKFFKETQKQIKADLSDALPDIKYKLIDRLDAEDYFTTRAEAEFLRLEIAKSEVKKWLAANRPDDIKDPDYIDIFGDYALDYERKPINTEYIDYYGTMGNYDGWLDCFKDNQETTGAIDEYRKQEADKQNNFERASLELKSQFAAIAEYNQRYLKNNAKISRQIGALKSVIKNAA